MKTIVIPLLFTGLSFGQTFNYVMDTTLYPMGTPSKLAIGVVGLQVKLNGANLGPEITVFQ